MRAVVQGCFKRERCDTDEAGPHCPVQLHARGALQRAPTNPEDDSDPSMPSIFTAIQKLGLELKSAKGDPRNLIIDHIERPDTN